MPRGKEPTVARPRQVTLPRLVTHEWLAWQFPQPPRVDHDLVRRLAVIAARIALASSTLDRPGTLALDQADIDDRRELLRTIKPVHQSSGVDGHPQPSEHRQHFCRAGCRD